MNQLSVFALLFACKSNPPPKPLVAPSVDPSQMTGATTEGAVEHDVPLIVVSGRIHPNCDGMALIDVLPLEGVDPEPVMTETVASDGSFSIDIPQLTPVALHCSCYENVQDIELDSPIWRVHPLSLKPLAETVSNLVLFQEGLRPDHSPVEGVTLEEAIEIAQIRKSAMLPEIIGPTPPDEQDKTIIIESEFFEQGPFEFTSNRNGFPLSDVVRDDFWTLFYDIEPDENANSDKGREGQRRPIGTAAASYTTWIKSKDLRSYFDAISNMIRSSAKKNGLNAKLLLPDEQLISITLAKGSLYNPEAHLVTTQFRKACDILKLNCPPPAIILRQRFVLNDKRSVKQSDEGAALSAFLWVRAEQLIRESQRQGIDPRPYLPTAEELVVAAELPVDSKEVERIIEQLKSGYAVLNVPFYSID